MDDVTLSSLTTALSATPDNVELRFVLVRAHVEREDAAAGCALLEGLKPEELSSEQRLVAARACRTAAAFEQALSFTSDEDPETQLERAHCLLALGREAEASGAYQQAVEANPALEDAALQGRLEAGRADSDEDEDGPRLRVLAFGGERDDELSALLQPAADPVTFDDVGGLEDVKKQVHRRIILPFRKPSLFARFKRKAGGGLLLYGPPGCGKTLLARATAGECDASFFNVALSDVLDMWMGESEAKLHALFEKARTSAPSVLFFDEVEGLGGKRQFSRDGSASKLVSLFLAEMDGFSQSNEGVLVIGATNLPWEVDAAFRRPGRFDRFMFVPPPDRAARERIFEIELEGRPLEGQPELTRLAKLTSGYSGADLKGVVETAVDLAIEETLESGADVSLGKRHLEEACKEVKPSSGEWLTTARNHARYANEGGQYDDVLDFLKKHGRDR